MRITNTNNSTDAYLQIYPGGEDPEGVVSVTIDISTLTTDEVDSNGNIKPGVPLTFTSVVPGIGGTTSITAAKVASGAVDGVTFEPIARRTVTTTLAGINLADNANLSSDTNDPFGAVMTSGSVVRSYAERNLGRALTAGEIAGFDNAKSKLKLI
jgi:hypothetical protein